MTAKKTGIAASKWRAVDKRATPLSSFHPRQTGLFNQPLISGFGFADEIAVCILVVAVILDDFGRKFFRDVHLFNSGLDAFLNGSRLNDRFQCLLGCGA